MERIEFLCILLVYQVIDLFRGRYNTLKHVFIQLSLQTNNWWWRRFVVIYHIIVDRFACKKSRILPNFFSRIQTHFKSCFCHLTNILFENIFNLIGTWHVVCNVMYKQSISVFNKKVIIPRKKLCFDAVAYFAHGRWWRILATCIFNHHQK